MSKKVVRHGVDGCGRYWSPRRLPAPRRQAGGRAARDGKDRPRLLAGRRGERVAHRQHEVDPGRRRRTAGIDLKFSDAQQKQENQIKAIRSYIQQKVDVIAFSPGRRDRLGRGAQRGQARQHPRDPHRPRGRLQGHHALQDLPRLRLHQGGQRRPASGWSSSTRTRRRRSTSSSCRARPAPPRRSTARRASPTIIRAEPEVQDRRGPDRRVHACEGQGGHGGLPEGEPRRSTCCSRTTTTWASARSRRSRRAGLKPGKDIKIVTDRRRQGRHAGARRRARSTSSSSAARCSARS